MKCDSEGIL